ncbi:AraC family transcriptional regulator [Xanthomonas euvesicatoria]|uniref:AraC family transcriptional regulator n=1 Tax=Xanthomonas euvesicatoria TaxID=456327 RepID=UPI0031F2FA61
MGGRAPARSGRRAHRRVALEAGFSDVSHFCRCFRKRFGSSARAYRNGANAG